MSKRKARSRPAPTPPTVVNGAALKGQDALLWRAANEDLAAPDFQRRQRGYGALRRLEAQLAEDRDAEAVRRGIDESVGLARMRGEKIEVSKQAEMRGRVRIRSRDGLETLEGSGAISAVQYKAGLFYRTLYEATDPERDLRSQMALPAMSGAGPGATGSPGGSEAWAERRLRLSRSIAALEDKVRTADRNGRAVRALREVAGHARCISHFVAGGGSQAVYRRALVLALDVCVGHFGLG
jgi:hypothetical protein